MKSQKVVGSNTGITLSIVLVSSSFFSYADFVLAIDEKNFNVSALVFHCLKLVLGFPDHSPIPNRAEEALSL